MESILFIIQDANFQSRSMIVPRKEFLEVRNDYYQTLKKWAKSITLNDGSNEYPIDNLLVQNILWKENMGRPEDHEYTKIFFDLQAYADGLDEDMYLRLDDKLWYDQELTNFCQGFNHVKNYLQAKELTHLSKKPINIVESFLLLQSNDGKIEQPMFDTVEEMFLNLYPNKYEA